MKARVLTIWLLGAVAFGQAPETMTKLVVRLESRDVPKGSFPTLPKTVYRAGTRFCRIEELPDAEHGIHGLVVINEPDTWLVNRLDKTARHQVDPGPTFNCRLPIFVYGENMKSAADTNDPVMGLEFGQELAFFEGKGATSAPGPPLQGKVTKAYILKTGDSQLFLFTTGTPERPVAVVRERGTKHEVYWYDRYEQVPFDAKLFTKPEGKVEEVR